MTIKFKDIPDWEFQVDEVSANVFKVSGKDASGRKIEMDGLDPDALLEDCRQYVRQLLGLPPVVEKVDVAD